MSTPEAEADLAPPDRPWQPSPVALERASFRRKQSVRSTLIAALSTLVVGVVLVLGVTSTPGWPAVQESFFNLHRAWTALPAVLDGLWLNIRIMAVCEVIILALGLLIAAMRTLRGPVFFPLRLAATVYVDLFRGLPLLLVIFLLGYGVPALRLRGVPGSVLLWGCAALVLTYSAYVAEVLRAGIESVHPSQQAASRSLGLTHYQTMRHVVVPQAIRRVLPPLLNDLVSLQKDSGLISTLGVVDAIKAAQIETAIDFKFAPYVLAGVLFVLLTIPMTRLTDYIARRQGLARAGGGVM